MMLKLLFISTLRGLGVPIPAAANLPYASVSLSKAFLQTASTIPGVGRIGLNELMPWMWHWPNQ
jgi:hypothetical protein